VKIPEGRELAAQVLVAVFVFVVCGIALFIAFGIESPAMQLGVGVSVMGLIFLLGLRIGGKKPGD
jgi:hypothetical protein